MPNFAHLLKMLIYMRWYVVAGGTQMVTMNFSGAENMSHA